MQLPAFRFSLRTFLILIAVLIIGIGIGELIGETLARRAFTPYKVIQPTPRRYSITIESKGDPIQFKITLVSKPSSLTAPELFEKTTSTPFKYEFSAIGAYAYVEFPEITTANQSGHVTAEMRVDGKPYSTCTGTMKTNEGGRVFTLGDM